MNLLWLASLTGFGALFLLYLGLGRAFLQIRAQAPRLPVAQTSALDGTLWARPVNGLALYFGAPRHARLRTEIERKMVKAGLPWGGLSGAQYLGALTLGSIAAGLGLILLTLGSGVALGTSIFLGVLAGGLVGFLGYSNLDERIAQRSKSLARRFPYFLDLAVMTMESGASFPETLEIFVRDNSRHPLAEEFRIVLSGLQLGNTFGEALGALLDRVDVDDIHNTVHALRQGQRMGVPISQVLRDQAEAMRFRRSQMAEREAEALKVMLLGPSTLMMVAVMLLVLAPAILGMINATGSGKF